MSNMRDAMGLCLPYGKANSQFDTEFEPATSTVWGYFNPEDGVPCYSLGLLKDILEHDQQLVRNGGKVEVEGMLHEVNYYVTASRTPGIFNVGGDLALFSMLIKAGDRDALANYAKLCIDNVYPRTQAFFSRRSPRSSWCRATRSTAASSARSLRRSWRRKARKWACPRSCSTCFPAWARAACLPGASAFAPPRN
jgi:hypothetical protein